MKLQRLIAREVVVAVTNGKLDFGPWEQVFYWETLGSLLTFE